MALHPSVWSLFLSIIVRSTHANELCDESKWNIIGGSWTYNAINCSVSSSTTAVSQRLWFGSADGLTPNNDYDDEGFTLTVAVRLDSGCNQQMWLLFRTSYMDIDDIWGNYGYRYGMILYDGMERLSVVRDRGDYSERQTIANKYVTSGFTIGNIYTLSIIGDGDTYHFYLDGELMIGPLTLTNVTSGTIGIWTYGCPSTWLSYMHTTPSPTTAPTIHPTMPTSAPTREVIDGYWEDDFEYVDKDTVANSGTSDVYDNGWYGLHSI